MGKKNDDNTVGNDVLRKLKESELRYKQLFEGVGDGIMVFSSKGVFLECNNVICSRLGYSYEEIKLLRPLDIVHPDFHSVMKENQRRLWAGETTVVESAHRCKNGSIIPVEVSARLIEYRDRLDELVENRTAELERSNRELEQFAYVASHDFKSPLRAVEKLAHWIEEDLGGALNDQCSRHFELLYSRIRRMERYLDDLLVYSRKRI